MSSKPRQRCAVRVDVGDLCIEIATHQVDNFLVLKGDERQMFRVLAIEDSSEQRRLRENFGDKVVASCYRRKLEVLQSGFK